MTSHRFTRRVFLGGAAAVGMAAALPTVRGAFAQEPRARIRIGLVPLISSGPMFIAQAMGLFDKVNLDADFQFFADGALAMPALVAGELDLTASTLNAGVFNTVARGAPFKLILDRGMERPGYGSMTIVASNAMIEAGFDSVDKGELLDGRTVAIQAPGSIDQYLLGRAAQKGGLDPRTDVEWSTGMPYPDMVRLIGAGQADAANIPVPLAFLVERENFGKIIGEGAAIEPNAQLACWVMSTDFLEANRSAAVRFAMVHTHAARLFVQAAEAKDPEVINIISEATRVPGNLIEAAAPRWTWYDHDGMPNVESVMEQYRFMSETMGLVSGEVTEQMLFDLSVAEEAAERLKTSNPFT
jgi:NitT/TauT family transport system substrate-binding protein